VTATQKRITLFIAAVLSVLGACAPPATPNASVRTPMIVAGSLADFGIEPPTVLAMREQTETRPVDPTVGHLLAALGIDEPAAECIIEHAGTSLPANDFPALRFASMYTDDREALAAAVAACVDPRSVAGHLASEDPLIASCIGRRADPAAASLVVAATAAAAIGNLAADWPLWMPAAGDCLDDPSFGSLPSPSVTPPPALADRLVAPDGWSFASIEPGTSGAAPVAEAVGKGHDAVAFEIRRLDSETPEALVWAIAWDPGDAVDRAFAESWLAWIRAGQEPVPDTIAGVGVERLVDPGTGLEQTLAVLDGLAVVLSDTGGGDPAFEAVLSVTG
jgi:hypothetical protein